MSSFFEKLVALKQLAVDDKGALRLFGTRMVIIRADVLLEMQNQLVKEFGTKGYKVMYEVGKYQGKTSFKEIFQKVNKLEKTFSLFKLSNPLFDLASKILSTVGWGIVVPYNVSNGGGTAIIELRNSPLAQAYLSLNKKADAPVCYYTAGLFSGALENASGNKTICIEHSCAAQGNKACIFEVKLDNK